jgi:cytochrome c
MKKGLVALFVCIFLVGVAGHALAVGTSAEAEAMVKQAAAFMEANGKEKAFAAFSDKKGQFVKEDLYIFAIDITGKVLAHGGNPTLVGKDMSGAKDADGKLFIKEIIEAAKTKGSGWIDYKWANPTTQKVDPKSTYYMKSGDVILGCGVYKQ